MIEVDETVHSTDNKQDDNSINDDEDALHAISLRFRFSDQAFTGVWRALRSLGWKYNSTNGSYHAPSTQNQNINNTNNNTQLLTFSTANDVLAYLDRGCLPTVASNLQSLVPLAHQREANEMDDHEGQDQARDTRKNLLRCMNLKELSKPAYADNKSIDGDNANDRNNDNNSSSVLRRPKRIREKRNLMTGSGINVHNSSTMTEQGTNLYLHKSAKRKRATKVNTNTASLDLNINSLVYPTLSECADLCKTSKSLPLDSFREQYENWRFLLSTNHSLLFYGSGSKYRLLNDFANTELAREGYVLIIEGFDPSVSISGVLDLLVKLFLNGTEPDQSSQKSSDTTSLGDDNDIPVIGLSKQTGTATGPIENQWTKRAISIAQAMAQIVALETLTPIYLVIHNIEGQGLRKGCAQDALSALLMHSTVPNGVACVRLVASIDHVDASSLLWSLTTSTNFSWIWTLAHTHDAYVNELVMLRDQDAHKIRSAKRSAREATKSQRVMEVLNTIAPRHKEVVQILARLQLQLPYHKDMNHNKKEGDWIDYTLLRAECKSRCIITKHAQLNDFLSELEDHGIILFKREKNLELVRVPYDKKKLEEMLMCDDKTKDGEKLHSG